MSVSMISECINNWIDEDASYKELINWYIESEKQTVSLLEKALNQKDYPRLVYMGDMLYGHGATYGFSFISYIGKSIERAAISKDDLVISILINELKNYLELVSRK